MKFILPIGFYYNIRDRCYGDSCCYGDCCCYVVDPPKVTVRVTNRQSEEGNKVKVTERSRVNMTCAVDANPPPIDGVREWSREGASVYQVV